ncbi:UPF0481 protein At3g47200-like [Bidens hawaiensis]|uniref:UPF0481 protein At3g47200-like n=1 Tax=Bidens hawaiensis TaxID=980011 RepID=UPI0040494ABB
MAMKRSESEYVMVEMPSNIHDNNMIAMEWVDCLTGKEATERERHIQKVLPLLLKSEKGHRNRECYVPAVVSLGPYHHNRPDLAKAEKYKLTTLEEYRSGTGLTLDALYKKVFKVVHDARKCYDADGSTDAYNDEEFNRMMLHDGCFILFFIECVSCADNRLWLNNEYLGASGFANVVRDLLLLENQIPFVVLDVLMKLRFPDDKGENILNAFFNYLNYGDVIWTDKKVLKYTQQPLHLLELYRSNFISLSAAFAFRSSKASKMSSMVRTQSIEKETRDDYDYVQRSRSFDSVTQLKSRWIFLKCTSDKSRVDMKFKSYRWYGEFKLARRAVSSYTKAIYLNMIAYEMCPHNPNDYRVSTYLRMMKSLITQREDVRELRRNNIMLHSLGSDEEVAKMYDEIDVPAVNLYMFHHIRHEIEKLRPTKYKTWIAELITDYLGSPWKAAGILVGTAILCTSLVQTYIAINPRGR